MMSTVSQSKPETANLGAGAGFTFDHDCSDLTSVTSHAHGWTNPNVWSIHYSIKMLGFTPSVLLLGGWDIDTFPHLTDESIGSTSWANKLPTRKISSMLHISVNRTSGLVTVFQHQPLFFNYRFCETKILLSLPPHRPCLMSCSHKWLPQVFRWWIVNPQPCTFAALNHNSMFVCDSKLDLGCDEVYFAWVIS